MKRQFLYAVSTIALSVQAGASHAQDSAVPDGRAEPNGATANIASATETLSSGQITLPKSRLSSATKDILRSWANQRNPAGSANPDPDYSEFWVEAHPAKPSSANRVDEIFLNWAQKTYPTQVNQPLLAPRAPVINPVADDSNWREAMYHEIGPDDWGEIATGRTNRLMPKIRTNLTGDGTIDRKKPSEVFLDIRALSSSKIPNLQRLDTAAAVSQLKFLKMNAVPK